MISVFRRTGDGESVVCRLSERNAKLTQECMGKDEVSVQVTVDEVLPIRVMDYIRVDGAVYTLNRMTDYDEVSDVEFRYQLIFEGAIYQLMDKMFVDLERNSDRFSLTATLREFTDLLVANINSVDSGWSAGDLPETERKNVTFESVSCREVLNRLASEFGVEYYLKDRQICFAERFENRTSLVFERGKGKGLYKLTCKNADTGNTVTRVRVYGSTENLPVGYRGGQADRLQLPMADGKPVYYLEDFSEFSKVVERTVHFEDVKPMFQGDVATVGDDFNRRIICPAIDFDLNAVAVGSNARVHFLTGELTGVSFEFEWDASKKELNLIRQEDQMALPDADEKRPLIPNETKKARVGDRFTFTGISLPQAYVDSAERELLAKGQEWLSFYKQLRVNFGLEVDYRFLRDSGYALHVGDVVTVKVPKLGMEKMLRVLSVEKDLYSGKLSCNVSNYLTESWEKRIEGQIQATQGSVDRINLNASYLVEATRAWVAQRFARLAGGNRFVGKQEVDGDVELAADRKLSIGDAVVQVAKGLFRTVLSVAGKHGEDVEVEAAGLKAKRVTAEEVSSPDFVSGFLGSGARLKGSHLELDELTVRKRMNVYELMIEKVKSVGGNLIVSVGSAKIEAVTDEGDFFRCSVEAAGNGSERPFVVDDQVLCQTFGGDRVKRYWRRVVGTGDGFFDLSKTDCEAGSAAPEAGDEVVQLGHRSDRARQSAILLCAVGADAPYTDHYEGIDGFSLAGKLVSREGKLTGIVDDVFGELSGAGLYARNVFLRGSLALSTGQKVEERISELGQEQVLQKETLTEMKADQGGFNLRVSQVEEKAIAATDAVNGLQIGGVNLMDGTADFGVFSVTKTLPESFVREEYYFRNLMIQPYMVSFDARNLGTTKTTLHCEFWGSEGGDVVVEGKEWKRYGIVTRFKGQSVLYFWNLNPGEIEVKNIKVEEGNKPTAWSPSVKDTQENIGKGKLFVRGTSMSNDAMRCVILNNDNHNVAIEGRGLNLITINRNTLQIVDNNIYDTYFSSSDISNLVNKLNGLSSEVIVILTSYDEASYGWTTALTGAIERCGGTGIKPGFRVPYAFVGIPGIGKGRGLEVVTNAEANAPYAEISTQIINGVPVGINATSSFLADQALGYIDSLTENKKIEWVDATGLDEEKYYPVTLPLVTGRRATIRVESTLSESGVPSWAAHSQGFSCMCSWSVNGHGWGTINMDRLVSDFTYKFANVLPIGDISQMTNSSIEYIYVRGGGKYRFVTTNVRSIELKTSDYTIQEQTIGIRNVVTAPVPNLDVVESKLQTQINQTADTIGFSAFKKDYNTDKVLINTKFGEIETSYDRVSATVSNIDGRLGNIETEKSGFLVKTDFVNIFSENLNELGQRVMSYINVSPDAIKISSSKIEISGQTVFRDIANNQTFSIFSSGGYALNLNNNFKVTTDGMLYATNAEISGKITSNSNGNRIVIDPESRSFQMLSSGGTAFFKLSFYDGGASMELKTSLDVAKQISQVTITPSFIDLTYYSYFISLGATSTTFRTKRLTIDLSGHEGETDVPQLCIKGLKKITNTSGWDRLLVNLSNNQIAYG